MFYVEIQFANKTEIQTFADKRAARIFSSDLGDMFNAEEIWFDNERSCYIVTVPLTEIV